MSINDQKSGIRNPLLGWIAAAGLIALAVLRCVVVFTPQLWWASGARQLQFSPTTGFIVPEFGPAGTAVTDLLMIVVLAIAVADAAWRRQRVYSSLLGLWAIGTGFALWHGMRDAESLHIGGAWVGAMAMGLAALHLAHDAALRRLILAAAIALILPLAVQSAFQLLHEHPTTVQMFEENREQFARDRGWELDSAQLRQYERRLYQVEATGRFGFSNVFGSVAMTLSLLGIGAAVGCWRSDRHDPSAYIAGAVAAVGFVVLAMTFSKGAMLATIAAVGGTAVACIATRWLPKPMAWWRLAAVGIVAAGIVGVTARGMAGEPETAAGERSLLFRWHYWEASAAMVADEPITGVGPGRFQQAQMSRKNPLNPEDPADPHNVFAAWIATLGVGGWAWSAALVGMLVMAGGVVRRTNPDDPPLDADEPVGMTERTRWWLIAAAGLGGLLAGFLAERARHDMFSTPGWLAGAAGFVGVAGFLASRRGLDHFYARLGLFAAVSAALLHAQIEMSLTKPMSAPLLMSIVGLAAGIGCARRGTLPVSTVGRKVGFACIGGVTVVALVVVSVQVTPIVQREEALRRAAEVMALPPSSPQMAVDRSNAAVNQLRLARQAMPQDARLGFHEAQVMTDLAALFARGNQPAMRDRLLEEAIKAIQRSRDTGSLVAASWMHETNVAEAGFNLTSNPRWLTRAAEAAIRRTEVDPFGLESHLRAGDLSYRVGDRDAAADLYRRTLEIDRQTYLDPARQLTDEQRARIKSRLENPKNNEAPPPLPPKPTD